jgi:hypothetical protein
VLQTAPFCTKLRFAVVRVFTIIRETKENFILLFGANV